MQRLGRRYVLGSWNTRQTRVSREVTHMQRKPLTFEESRAQFSANLDKMIEEAKQDARAFALSDALQVIRDLEAEKSDSLRRAGPGNNEDVAYAQGAHHAILSAYRRVQSLL